MTDEQQKELDTLYLELHQLAQTNNDLVLLNRQGVATRSEWEEHKIKLDVFDAKLKKAQEASEEGIQ